MSKMMVSYCDNCRKGLPITPVKAIKKCNFCGSQKLCSMSTQPSSRIHKMAKDAMAESAEQKRKLNAAGE